MAVQKREFYRHIGGMGDEDWYYLARDSETGRVFIEHEWSYRGPESGSKRIDFGDSFTKGGQGTRQSRLLELIATLIAE